MKRQLALHHPTRSRSAPSRPYREPQLTLRRTFGVLLSFLTGLVLIATESWALDLYLRDGRLWPEGQELPTPNPDAQPVLFVHGHRTPACEFFSLDPLCSCDNDGEDCAHFRRTWMERRDNGLRSFAEAIDANPHLKLEPYYLNFVDDARSIIEDAQEIWEAVKRIIVRHNGGSELNPDVKVAIIAYSKGTISTRLYLKNLHILDDLGEPARWVSEFIAIAPPNHGTVLSLTTAPTGLWIWVWNQLFKESVHQLNNGYHANCLPFSSPSAIDFIEELNGHPMEDTHEDTYVASGNQFGQYMSEAPGSRENGDPLDKGTLYVTLFDESCRDGVGCHLPRINDCTTSSAYGSKKQGRSLAINLSPDAVNIPITGIDGGSNPVLEGLVVHTNIVHHPDTMCHALYTVAYHQADPTLICSVTNNLPKIPPR